MAIDFLVFGTRHVRVADLKREAKLRTKSTSAPLSASLNEIATETFEALVPLAGPQIEENISISWSDLMEQFCWTLGDDAIIRKTITVRFEPNGHASQQPHPRPTPD